MFLKQLAFSSVMETVQINVPLLGEFDLYTVYLHFFFNHINPIWVGFLGVRFEVGGGGKITGPPPYLKLVGIMLEASNLASKYKLICIFRKYTV